jgi:hypothetical protein
MLLVIIYTTVPRSRQIERKICFHSGKRDIQRDDNKSSLLRCAREKEHGERRAKEAALSVTAVPHTLHHPHF